MGRHINRVTRQRGPLLLYRRLLMLWFLPSVLGVFGPMLGIKPAVYTTGNTLSSSITTYQYDPRTDDLVTVTLPGGGATLYGYDGGHSVITTTQLLANTGNTFCPSALARPTARRTTTTTARPLSATYCSDTQSWRSALNGYDGHGQLISRTDGRGIAPGSLRTTSRDPSLAPPAPQLDPTQAPPYTTSYMYTAQGDLQSVTGPPITTSLNGTTSNAPVTTGYGADADGNVTTVTSPNGHATTTTYDPLGRPLITTGPAVPVYASVPASPSVTRGYDGDGNVVTTADALGDTTTRGYDPRGRLVALSNPLGATAFYTYTATELSTTQDNAGHVTAYGYDAAGRLTSALDPTGVRTLYQRDAVSNTVAITTPLGARGASAAATTWARPEWYNYIRGSWWAGRRRSERRAYVYRVLYATKRMLTSRVLFGLNDDGSRHGDN